MDHIFCYNNIVMYLKPAADAKFYLKSLIVQINVTDYSILSFAYM